MGVLLGAGRKHVEESVDFSAGIQFYKKAGMYVQEGDVLAEVHGDRDDGLLQNAVHRVLEAFTFSEEQVQLDPLIANFVTKDCVEEFDQSIIGNE